MASDDTAPAADEEQTIVYLGNRQPYVYGPGERTAEAGKFCTTVKIPASHALMEAIHDIVGPSGIWATLSADAAPAWVAAQGPLGAAIAGVLASHYRCELRDPEPETGA